MVLFGVGSHSNLVKSTRSECDILPPNKCVLLERKRIARSER